MTEESNQVTLTKLRNRAGLTRRQVAAELDVTEKTIYVWETSPNTPRLTVAQVQRLMEILNCSMEELVEATEKRPQS
ncbi:MAG: helix-turn-helix transcriptional regulator [Cyanobacteriota bacterium]